MVGDELVDVFLFGLFPSVKIVSAEDVLTVRVAPTLVEAALQPRVPVPARRLGRAVALVSSGMPSAQILVLLLHRFGLGRQAGELSFLFVFQYLAAVPTMTVLVTLALAVVY